MDTKYVKVYPDILLYKREAGRLRKLSFTFLHFPPDRLVIISKSYANQKKKIKEITN